MKLSAIFGLLGIIGIFHTFTAFFVSKEVNDYPLFNIKQKIIWHLIVWLIPFYGNILVHKKLHLGSASGVSTGGDTYIVGVDGGSSGCDSGGGGDCG